VPQHADGRAEPGVEAAWLRPSGLFASALNSATAENGRGQGACTDPVVSGGLVLEDTAVIPSAELKACSFDNIVSRNPHVLGAKKLAQQAAALDGGLLIVGEQGTEKELFAATVHSTSKRASMPLVELDCFYHSSTLLERMLFGEQVDKEVLQPVMKRCCGGTLFVQDVGNLPLVAQSRLARAMRTGRLTLGEGEVVDFNCRIVASTSDDLLPAVEDRQFRADFYEALTQTVIFIPPLRHRKEDIPVLVQKFIREFAYSLNKPLNNISGEAMNALTHYKWPGNVRELKTVIGRSAALAKGETILMDHLPKSIQRARRHKEEPDEMPLPLATIEKRHIRKVLDFTGWHKVRTAQILGIDRSTLYDKIKRYNLINPADRLLEVSQI